MASLEEWTQRLDTPSVILGVGIPGAGKTTVLSKLSQETGITRVCPDDIRLELTGSESDQSANREVWEEAYRRVYDLLAEHQSVIVDATHVNALGRQEAIADYRNNGAKAIGAVIFRTPLDIALARNAQRTKNVPNEVIARMHSQLKNTTVQASREGIDLTYIVNHTDTI